MRLGSCVFSTLLCKTNPISIPHPLGPPRHTGHEQSLPAVCVAGHTRYEKMQNEPNFTPKEHAIRATSSPNHANNTKFTTTLLYFYPKIPKKTRTFLHFYQLLDTNILNSMYNKDLQKYSPRNTLHERSLHNPPQTNLAGKNAKQTQFAN